MNDIKIGGVYRNLKNKGLYKVVGFARHTETEEILVLYTIKEKLHPHFVMDFARPLKLFKEKFVEVDIK